MAKKKPMIHDLYRMKRDKEKITWITAYDYPTAQFVEAAGMDMILVGDSLGMCVYGYAGTVPVTMDQCIYHTEAVRRAASQTFIIGDMPFGAYQVGRTHDAGATTTAAVYESLGRPSYIAPFFTAGQTVYRRVIDPTFTCNLLAGYQFGENAPAPVRRTLVRIGVTNLNDLEPPLASSEGFSYDASVNQSLLPGRTWTLEITRRF